MRGVQVRAIRRNLLCDTDTSSLRNLGVTGEDDDEEDEGRGAKVIKPVVEHMNHLFRPNRDDPGYVLSPSGSTLTSCGPKSRCALALMCSVQHTWQYEQTAIMPRCR